MRQADERYITTLQFSKYEGSKNSMENGICQRSTEAAKTDTNITSKQTMQPAMQTPHTERELNAFFIVWLNAIKRKILHP